MAFHALSLAFSLLATVGQPAPLTGAPPAPPTARYCLRVDPSVESRVETIRCETRDVWASMDVDVDREWSSWGVRVLT